MSNYTINTHSSTNALLKASDFHVPFTAMSGLLKIRHIFLPRQSGMCSSFTSQVASSIVRWYMYLNGDKSAVNHDSCILHFVTPNRFICYNFMPWQCRPTGTIDTTNLPLKHAVVMHSCARVTAYWGLKTRFYKRMRVTTYPWRSQVLFKIIPFSVDAVSFGAVATLWAFGGLLCLCEAMPCSDVPLSQDRQSRLFGLGRSQGQKTFGGSIP